MPACAQDAVTDRQGPCGEGEAGSERVSNHRNRIVFASEECSEGNKTGLRERQRPGGIHVRQDGQGRPLSDRKGEKEPGKPRSLGRVSERGDRECKSPEAGTNLIEPTLPSVGQEKRNTYSSVSRESTRAT